MKTPIKLLLGLLSITPIASSTLMGAITAYRMIMTDIELGGVSPDPLSAFERTSFDTTDLLIFVSVIGFVVVLELALGVGFAIHAARDPRLGSTGKALWIVALLFAGIFALPAYFIVFLMRDPPPARVAALDRSPLADAKG